MITLKDIYEKLDASFRTVNNITLILCPFHNEETPSLQLLPEQKFHCLSCGKNGSSKDYPEVMASLMSIAAELAGNIKQYLEEENVRT